MGLESFFFIGFFYLAVYFCWHWKEPAAGQAEEEISGEMFSGASRERPGETGGNKTGEDKRDA